MPWVRRACPWEGSSCKEGVSTSITRPPVPVVTAADEIAAEREVHWLLGGRFTAQGVLAFYRGVGIPVPTLAASKRVSHRDFSLGICTTADQGF